MDTITAYEEVACQIALIKSDLETRRAQLLAPIAPDQLKDIIAYGFKRSFCYQPYSRKRKWVRQIIDYYETLEKKFGIA